MEAVGLLVGAHFLLLYVQPGLVDPSWRTATSVKSKHRSQVFEQRHNWDNGEYRAVNGLTIAKGGRCSEVTIMNVDPKSCAGTSARRSLWHNMIKACLHLRIDSAQRASGSLPLRTAALPTIPWAARVGANVGMLFFCKDNCGSHTDKNR